MYSCVLIANGLQRQNQSLSSLWSLSLTFLQVILALGDYMSIQCHACIGGTNVGEDIRKLDYGQHVVSGTPGRVFGKLFIALFHDSLLVCCITLFFFRPNL